MFHHPNWTIPNILTLVRILLTPAIVMAFVNNHLELVWIIFAIAGFTDALDGFLARALDQRSLLGAVLDPLADKILLDTTYICIGLQGWVPPWLVVLVVSRDFIIVGGLSLLGFLGVDVTTKIDPSLVSKCNTAAQVALVILILVARTFGWDCSTSESLLVLLVTLLTVVSGVHYLLKGIVFFSEGED
ncbi:CDP-alcohol phosphatidyltransferase [Desulfoplanes formicivorans]|uniref:CDP-diacylglycerol--glycerol-3-phosphate 3-phosphatidyltransferase n=2 Tax=Desulfoplanes formicivorans TaxID=1592317 RepID=A0A194AJN6_9BACT|nr:CDP-alcohol phosphatidyltransferase [Desulfoplanes formicivorans]